MSFAHLQKSEIINSQYKNACCKKALLQGIIASKADKLNENEYFLTLGDDEQLAFFKKLFQEFFGKTPEPYKLPSGGRGKSVRFSSPAISKYFLSLGEGKEFFSSKCPSCQSSFLRGVFLATGRICDPAKQYLLELSPHNFPERFYEHLSEWGIESNINRRKTENIIYIKKRF